MRPFNVETDSADIIRSPGTPVTQGGLEVAPSAAESARLVTELFAEHHLGLVRLALLMVGDLATAEDVVQDAFKQLHRRWHGLRQHSSALDYARSAVLNGCRSVLRRRLVARRHEGLVAASPPYSADAAIALEQRSELIDAFRSLPRRQREVVALRYYLDLSVADTARRFASVRAPSGLPPPVAWPHWPVPAVNSTSAGPCPRCAWPPRGGLFVLAGVPLPVDHDGLVLHLRGQAPGARDPVNSIVLRIWARYSVQCGQPARCASNRCRPPEASVPSR